MEGTFANLPRLMELKEKYKVRRFRQLLVAILADGSPSERSFISSWTKPTPLVPSAPTGAAFATTLESTLAKLTSSWERSRSVRSHLLMLPLLPSSADFSPSSSPAFGAAGGYIAGSHAMISALRLASAAELYAEAMSPAVVSQIITSTASIMGPSSLSFVPSLATLPAHLIDGSAGKDRLRRLAFNCRYLHSGLRRLGFIVYGSHDSPIVPLVVYGPGKLGPFSRLMLERHNIIVVLAAFPASVISSSSPIPLLVADRSVPIFCRTALATPRIRLCLSSAHTKEDLDCLLRAIDDVGTTLGLKLSPSGKREKVEDVIRTGVEMVRRYELTA